MKNKNIFIFIYITTTILPAFADLRVHKKFGTYDVSVSRSQKTDVEEIIITKNGKKMYEDSGIGEYFYLGNAFDESLHDKDPYSGKDITGEKIPNLIISEWTGGAHCCHFVSIFELGKNFRKIITIEAKSSDVRLVDISHNGFPEIEFDDGSIDYLFACFACSPKGHVVLKYKNGTYELDTRLMKKPAPSMVDLKKAEQKIKIAFRKYTDPDLPYEFLKYLMDLSYSGNYELALKVADEVWPPEKAGLVQFKKDFAEDLHASKYWKEF